jgi:hypothetical protein
LNKYRARRFPRPVSWQVGAGAPLKGEGRKGWDGARLRALMRLATKYARWPPSMCARSASSRRITTMMHRRSLRPYMAYRQSSHRSQALHRVRVLFPPRPSNAARWCCGGAQQVTPTMSQSRMWWCAAETAHLSAQHVLSQTLVIPRWRHVSPAIGRLARAIVLQCAP